MQSKALKWKKLEGGRHGVFDGDEQLGHLPHEHLCRYLEDEMGYQRGEERDQAPGHHQASDLNAVLRVDREVDRATRTIMARGGVSYAKAMKEVLRDTDLLRRYQAAHRQELSMAPTPRPGADEEVGERVRQLMKDKALYFREAFKKVLD